VAQEALGFGIALRPLYKRAIEMERRTRDHFRA